MTNFSETLFRCHAIGNIMTESRGKSNLEKYNDAVALLAEENAKYEAISNKTSKSAFNGAGKTFLIFSTAICTTILSVGL